MSHRYTEYYPQDSNLFKIYELKNILNNLNTFTLTTIKELDSSINSDSTNTKVLVDKEKLIQLITRLNNSTLAIDSYNQTIKDEWLHERLEEAVKENIEVIDCWKTQFKELSFKLVEVKHASE